MIAERQIRSLDSNEVLIQTDLATAVLGFSVELRMTRSKAIIGVASHG
jgi:hypothetical protein